MEEHFLNNFVEGLPGFRPEPWYNRDGDCIIFQTAHEAIVAERVDQFLTIYRSVQDNRAIGLQVKGVQAIIRQFGLDGLAVSVEGTSDQVTKISIAALLLAAYEQGPMTLARRRAYAAAIPSSEPSPEIPVDEVVAV